LMVRPPAWRDYSTKKLRNVGIIAHVDAGKTTTSEVMLYYANYIQRVGKVDDGNTVLDHKEQEKERGITVSSAAITFGWRGHQINYIDTPGHVDFTMEVESAMSVLDGGILVLDGSAGVEPQTLTVWRQAAKYGVPRIAYINKLDKKSASVEMTLKSIKQKLNVQPLVIQQLIGDEGKNFTGLVDLVSMRSFLWKRGDGSMGRSMETLSEEQLKTSMFHSWEQAVCAREELVETVSDYDDLLAEKCIEYESTHADVSSLQAAIRRVALDPDSPALVTLLGSSGVQVGVQPLMDAIVDYCPSPEDRNYIAVTKSGNNFCGLVFKVVHDPNKGCLCFVRVYSGAIRAKESLYNISQGTTEKLGGRLMVAFADDYLDVDIVTAGNIAVIAGLKVSVTGDTLVSSQSVAKNWTGKLVGPTVPEPVVFCSVDPPSLSKMKQFQLGLTNLSREDPSLRVREDQETGQTVVGGMGELHLEIVRDRMEKEYKVEVEVNKLQIAYREILMGTARDLITFSRTLAGKEHFIQLEIEVQPVTEGETAGVVVSSSRETQDSINKLWKSEQTQRLIEKGLAEGLERGPMLGGQVRGCLLTLHHVTIGRGTQDTIVRAGCASIARDLVTRAGVSLAEPVMNVQVTTDTDLVGIVKQDLIMRRGQVDSWSESGSDTATVTGLVPLAELRGYSAKLRKDLSGRASITMELGHYQVMDPHDEAKAVEDVTGFER